MKEELVQLVEEQREALVRAVVDCVGERDSQGAGLRGMPGRAQRLQDAYALLRHLEQAVCAERTDLFTNHVAWVKATHTAYGLPADELVAALRCLQTVLRQRLSADLYAVVDEYLVAGITCLPLLPTDLPSYVDANFPLAELTMHYLDALLAGDRHEAGRLIHQAVAQGTGIEDIYLKVFQRAQHEIGRLWQMNRISVAQEHFCTAATQQIMAQLYPHIFTTEKTGRHFIATCIGGDLHEIGLRMVADLLEMAGWDTYYLGADVPVESVVRTLGERAVHVLGVSVTMAYHLAAAEALIRSVRASEAARNLKILVGGQPFNVMPDLWKQLGADAHARDAREAVRVANELVAGHSEERG